MDVVGRFAALVGEPEGELQLDEAALLVGATSDSDVDLGLRVLDELAARCPGPTPDQLLWQLFVGEAFAGNRTDYADPRNSYLHMVLARRIGIPITLSIVAMEVGRRRGVELLGVGMPGHFLVRAGGDPEAFYDPFTAGQRLDRDGCERRFRVLHGPSAPFVPSYLDPVGPRAILSRVLGNLKPILTDRRDRKGLESVLRMRLAVPGAPLAERQELAGALAADGRFLQAAAEMDELGDRAETAGDTDLARDARAGALSLRARMN
ncbi:MAG: SirB1 family protein [Acidimicrobiia bacterium]